MAYYPPTSNWYVLRVTYGREKAASDYLAAHGVEIFCPMQKVAKRINGKIRLVEKSRLPNLFFAYGTEEQLQSFVYDNVNLPFLRFYYRHFHARGILKKVPLLGPQRQLETFRQICSVEGLDTFVSPDEIRLFRKGELVRVVQGPFAGVCGRVARFKGQQRVGICVDQVATVATAYVPTAFLEKMEE